MDESVKQTGVWLHNLFYYFSNNTYDIAVFLSSSHMFCSLFSVFYLSPSIILIIYEKTQKTTGDILPSESILHEIIPLSLMASNNDSTAVR